VTVATTFGPLTGLSYPGAPAPLGLGD